MHNFNWETSELVLFYKFVKRHPERLEYEAEMLHMVEGLLVSDYPFLIFLIPFIYCFDYFLLDFSRLDVFTHWSNYLELTYNYLYRITTSFLLPLQHTTKSTLSQLPGYSVLGHLLTHFELIMFSR